MFQSYQFIDANLFKPKTADYIVKIKDTDGWEKILYSPKYGTKYFEYWLNKSIIDTYKKLGTVEKNFAKFIIFELNSVVSTSHKDNLLHNLNIFFKKYPQYSYLKNNIDKYLVLI